MKITYKEQKSNFINEKMKETQEIKAYVLNILFPKKKKKK